MDERVIELLVDEQISIGDYVLTNGALAAAVVSDALVRLLPGVLGGGEEATVNESFTTRTARLPSIYSPNAISRQESAGGAVERRSCGH